MMDAEHAEDARKHSIIPLKTSGKKRRLQSFWKYY